MYAFAIWSTESGGGPVYGPDGMFLRHAPIIKERTLVAIFFDSQRGGAEQKARAWVADRIVPEKFEVTEVKMLPADGGSSS